MSPDRLHVALVVPATNTVMEPDFHRRSDAGWAISTWRLPLDRVTREAEVRMLEEELPRVADQLRRTQPDVSVFGCTSAGSLGGLEHDRDVGAQLGGSTGASVVTVVGAMKAALDVLRPQRVVVLTPYAAELTESVTSCVRESGYDVVKAVGLGIVDNAEIGDVTPDEIRSFARSEVVGTDADCLFLSCTNWRAIDAREPLEAELGIPVLTSNQVTLDGVMRAAAGVRQARP